MPSYHIFFSPVELFRSRLSYEPAWAVAFVPVIAYAIFMATSASLLLVKVRWVVGQATSASGVEMPNLFAVDMLTFIFGVAGHIILFWLVTGAFVAVDVLFSGSKQAGRLVELSAISYWTQVPWAVASISLMMFYTLEPLSASRSSLITEITQFQNEIARTPYMLTFSLLTSIFLLWWVALQAAALRVVSGFTVRGAWAAGIVLGSMFVVIPWAVQRF